MNSPNARQQAPAIGWRAKVLVGLLAVLLSAVACEVMARMLYEAPPDPTREPAILYQTVPGVGFTPAVNQRGWIDDGLVTTNSMGLRGAEPAVPKPAGTVRVLAIGDSTTFGWGVNDDETYPHLLQQKLAATRGRAWDVVNAGVSGYDLRRATRWLAYLAPRLQPDIVVVGAFWNDLPYEQVSPEGVPLSAEAAAIASGGLPEPEVLPSGSDAAAGGRSKPFRIRGEPTRLNSLLRASRLLYVLRQTWAAMIAPTGAASNQLQWEQALLEGRRTPAIDRAWLDVETSLRQMKAMGAEAGYDVGVLVMPVRAQVESPRPAARYQTRLREMAASLGLFVIDPLDDFVAEPKAADLFIPYDRMHFSPRGNERLAEAAFQVLRDRPRASVRVD